MCALCSAAAGTDLICASCRNALPTLGPACPGCALPSTTGSACGRCLADPPAYDATRAAYIYAFPLDRLVQAFKYNGALSFAAWFAEAMGNLRGVAPVADLMVAMPLSANRQRERGFNHALEIARPLAVRTGIRLAAHAVTRVRDTAAQATLPWSERARNVRGAFTCAADVAGKSVLVVDDVMTTGASLDELAQTLKRAGAARVENWVIARTLPPSHEPHQPHHSA